MLVQMHIAHCIVQCAGGGGMLVQVHTATLYIPAFRTMWDVSTGAHSTGACRMRLNAQCTHTVKYSYIFQLEHSLIKYIIKLVDSTFNSQLQIYSVCQCPVQNHCTLVCFVVGAQLALLVLASAARTTIIL